MTNVNHIFLRYVKREGLLREVGNIYLGLEMLLTERVSA